jgi:hypothetical protein
MDVKDRFSQSFPMFAIWAQGFVIHSNAEVDLSVIYILFGSSNNSQCPRKKFIT